MSLINFKMNNQGRLITGIDISDRSIEVVQIKRHGQAIKLRSFGQSALAPGAVIQGKIINKAAVIGALKEIIASAGPDKLVVGPCVFYLPSSAMYTIVMEVRKNRSKEAFEHALEDMLFSSVPVYADDCVYGYSVIDKVRGGEGKKEETMKIVIAASSKSVVKDWDEVIKLSGFKPILVDIEMLAILRGMGGYAPKHPFVLVDVGAERTFVSFFGSKGLLDAYSLLHGGNQITEHLAESLSISKEDSENLKRSAKIPDMEKNSAGADLILIQEYKSLFKELFSDISYFETRHRIRFEEMIVIGGGSKIHGLVSLLNHEYHDRLVNRASSPWLPHSRLNYLGALGAALRGAFILSYKDEPFFKLNDPKAVDIAGDLMISAIDSMRTGRKLLMRMAAAGLMIAVAVLIASAYRKHPNFQFRAEKKFVSVSTDAINENEETTEGVTSTPETIKVTIKASGINLNVRSGPGLAYEKKMSASPGDVFELVSEDGNWIEIGKDGGSIGWVRSEFTDRTAIAADLKADISGEKTKDESAAKVRIINIGVGLNIRSGPGTENRVIGKAVSGNEYESLAEEGEWIEISFGTEQGWVLKRFVEPIE